MPVPDEVTKPGTNTAQLDEVQSISSAEQRKHLMHIHEMPCADGSTQQTCGTLFLLLRVIWALSLQGGAMRYLGYIEATELATENDYEKNTTKHDRNVGLT